MMSWPALVADSSLLRKVEGELFLALGADVEPAVDDCGRGTVEAGWDVGCPQHVAGGGVEGIQDAVLGDDVQTPFANTGDAVARSLVAKVHSWVPVAASTAWTP